jgi:hypothetical protein
MDEVIYLSIKPTYDCEKSEAIVWAWSGDFKSGEQELLLNFINIGIPLKIEILMAIFFKNYIFGESYDLLPQV